MIDSILAGQLGRRVFQIAVAATGGIAVVTGIAVVAAGASGLPGATAASATVDNELRFFAVFWLAFGIVALRAAARYQEAAQTIRCIAYVVFAAGTARLISLVTTGTPHPVFVGVMIVELVGAPWLLFWQSRLNAAR